MTLQYSVAVRNAQLDALEAAIGTSPLLRVYDAAPPANCAAAAAGTVLAEVSLPSDWMATASAGDKALAGVWEDASANASGFGRYYRILNTAGNTAHIQGPVSQNWAGSTPYSVGQQVNNGGNVYVCTVAGISASSGGPSGTGTGISDGACTWNYVQSADGGMVLNNTSIAVSQSVTITGFTITAGNA